MGRSATAGSALRPHRVRAHLRSTTAWLIASFVGHGAAAQSPGLHAEVEAGAVAAFTHVYTGPFGRSYSELKLEQPVAMLHARAREGRVRFDGMLNLEGLTMPGGVLTLGAWGEGFLERRHPHTYAHELMLSAVAGRVISGSLSAGKGFVAFGTDDPMSRPALRYPVNHHWSQVLERAVLIGGFEAGPLRIEGSVFNGDEPERPSQWPRLSRFGDSRALRVTILPREGLEIQASRAWVKSPEHRPGAGLEQRKSSVSGRYEVASATGSIYALGEWASTTELGGLLAFESWLLEGEWRKGSHRPYYRFERTERPEEERVHEEPFRSVRPHLENAIIGVTRWTIHTAGYGRRWTARGLSVEPLVEGSVASVRETQGAVFSARAFFGRTTIWTLTIGLRVGSGPGRRMGRYGVSADRGTTEMHPNGH